MYRWDTYPVPQVAPGEYSDNTKWGIVPAWGFAVVVESKIPSLQAGTLLFGFWPMASAPVDLELQESAPQGRWVEISKHREQVMSIYNAYQERGHFELPAGLPQLDYMAWASLFGATWVTGYLLNRHTFTSDPEIQPPIGPLGKKIPWAKDNADLSQAVVVSLSASGKTARGFAWQVLTKRAQGSGPLAFLQVTQAPDTIGDVASRHARIPLGAFGYSQLDAAVDRAAGFKPQKLVIVDFGGRDNALKRLMGCVNEKPELKEAQTVILQVGGEQKVHPSPLPLLKTKKLTLAKVYSMEEALGMGQDMQQFNKILCNTADILDGVLASGDKQAYLDDLRLNWEQWISDKEANLPDFELVWGRGISGESGIRAGWDRIATGSVAPHEGLVYRLF